MELEPDPPPDPRHAVGTKLLRSGLLNLINYGIGIPVMLLLVPFLLKTLGKEGYGVWTAANTLIGLAGLVELGLVNATVKMVAQHAARDEDEELSRVVSTAVLLHTALCAVLALAALTPLPIPPAMVGATLALFVARFPLIAYSGVISGMQRQDLVQSINLASTLGFAALAVVVLRSGRGVVELMWTSAGMAALATLGYVAVAHGLRPALAVRPGLVTRDSIRRVLGFGLQVWASSISGTVHTSMDKMTLVSVLSRTDLVGLYHIAAEIVDKVRTIPSVLLGPAMAGAADLHSRGESDAVQGLYRRAQRYNWIACALMFGGSYAVGAPFVRVWLGSDQPFVVQSLYVLCAGFMAAAIAVPAMHVLLGMHHPGDVLVASFVGAGLNVVLSLGIALTHGPEWIAAGTSFAYALEAAWLLQRFHARTSYPWRETFIVELPRILGAALVAGWVGQRLAGAAARANPLPLLAGGALYCAVFALVCVLTGAVDGRDLVQVKRLLGRPVN